LSALSKSTIYIAHRGSAALYPEETDLAYEKSFSDGQMFLESDVQLLHDGGLGLMHDSTVDRTTTSSGPVAALSSSDWLALRVDGDAWHGSNYGNDLTIPLFDAWVSKYKGKAILVPEDKDLHSMPSMLTVLAAQNVSPDQILIQCFSMAPLPAAIAAGYQVCYLISSAVDPAPALAAKVGWVGMNTGLSDDEFQRWVASGIKVLAWTVNRHFDRDSKLLLGVAGFFSDDPTYLSSFKPLRTQDGFVSGTWIPGMFGGASDFDLASRGQFFSGGYWGYSASTQGYAGCLHGYLCPIKGEQQPTDYQVDLSVLFGASLNDDATRWAAVFLSVDDRPFIDGSDATAGYHILFRKNGSVEVFKKAPQSHAALLVARAGTAIQTGGEVRYRITVADTIVKVARLDASGNEVYAASAADSTYRTPYLHLGRNGLACQFRQLIVS
jgi:glycerophosphoryl diester phosphodiesterase